MNGLVEKSGKKYFMEQFLYADSTEAFSYNTQIEESQVADFVKRSAPILKGYYLRLRSLGIPELCK